MPSLQRVTARRVAAGLAWVLETDLSRPVAVGKAQLVRIAGWCYHASRAIRSLSLVIDGEPRPIVHRRVARPDVLASQPPGTDPAGYSVESGFWTVVPFGPVTGPRDVRLELRARLSGGEVRQVPLGALRLLPGIETEIARAEFPVGEGPRLVICLATHEPPLDLLESQLDSIVAQTHRNWIAIIQDDASSADVCAEIHRLAGRDPRFQVHRNGERVGFYRNFERCLARVPPGTDFVALCDQDDTWYPGKLASCLAAFGPDTQLAYSDMDVVARSGEVISRTFWTTRRNNSTDLAALLFANTVTGAASVFRASLLQDLLPFPEPVGDAYHDHWIACTALAKGSLAYVDRPLYAYRQHGSNVLGHQAPAPARLMPELRKLLRWLASPRASRREARGELDALAIGFRRDVVRIALMAGVLLRRLPDAPARKRRILAHIARIDRSTSRLALEALRCGLRGRPTGGAELTLLRAQLAQRVLNAYHRVRRRRLSRLRPAPNAASR